MMNCTPSRVLEKRPSEAAGILQCFAELVGLEAIRGLGDGLPRPATCTGQQLSHHQRKGCQTVSTAYQQ